MEKLEVWFLCQNMLSIGLIECLVEGILKSFQTARSRFYLLSDLAESDIAYVLLMFVIKNPTADLVLSGVPSGNKFPCSGKDISNRLRHMRSKLIYCHCQTLAQHFPYINNAAESIVSACHENG